MLAADGGGQLRDVLDLLPDRIPRVVLVQVLEDRARRQLQVARRQFVGQLLGVGGQIAERAQLDPLVAGRGDLVEEPGVRGLPRIIGKPHAPGVGCGADEDAAHVSVNPFES